MRTRSILNWRRRDRMPAKCRPFCSRQGRRSTRATRQARSKSSSRQFFEGRSPQGERPLFFAARTACGVEDGLPGGATTIQTMSEGLLSYVEAAQMVAQYAGSLAAQRRGTERVDLAQA